MKYTVVIESAARKDIRRLDSSVQDRIDQTIGLLADDPRPPGCRKMVGSLSRWRVRVGVYRIVYDINDSVITVRIIKVAHRKDAYR